MKQFLIPVLAILISVSFSCQLNAQKDKKDKTVTIKIEKEVDGKKTVIDTTFTMKDREDLSKIIQKHGVKADIYHKQANEININIETDDSVDVESKSMVWVSVDEDDKVHEHIIKEKGNNKMIFITEDGDVEIIKIKNGNKINLEEIDENIIIEELKGDSSKITTKFIIKSDKGGKNKIKKKVYNISKKSSNGENVFIMSDDGINHEHVIIKEIKNGNDSIDIIIKKIKKGKKGKKVIATSEGNYAWTLHEVEDIVADGKNKKAKKVTIEIHEIDEAGLKALKQKKKPKEFKIKDFNVFVNDEKGKVTFNFSTPQKGSLSVKIVNKKGKIVFKDSKKQFEGKYKNEIEAKSGTYYFQFSQGKKHYMRKMVLVYNK